jgi:DNA replication licensing factor MCM5
VRDINTVENNQRIANHILGLHQGKISRPVEKDIDFELLKKYIYYAKRECDPRLTVRAAEKLQELYVADRQNAYEHKKLTQSKNSIPITVRQLEAVIRLSEALARMRLKNDVGIEEVDEAHYLF